MLTEKTAKAMPIIDTSISVVLHLSKDGRHALCVAKLRREGDKIYASPTMIGAAFAQFTGAELEEAALELMAGGRDAASFYHYRRLINLDSGLQCEFPANLE
jgi:hypothetical protein